MKGIIRDAAARTSENQRRAGDCSDSFGDWPDGRRAGAADADCSPRSISVSAHPQRHFSRRVSRCFELKINRQLTLRAARVQLSSICRGILHRTARLLFA